MAGNYGKLVVELSANIARFQSDLGQATSMAQGAAGKLNKIAGGIKSAFIGIGAGLSFAALTTGVRSAIDDLDELGKAAQRTGLAAKSFKGFDAAFMQAGGEVGELEKAITKLNVKMGEAASGQNDKFAAELRALGVDISQGTEPALLSLADTFAQIASPAERAALGADLFGKAAGTKMVAFLGQGSAAIAEQVKRMGDLSGVTEESVKQAAEFNDRMDDLAQHATAAGTGITIGLLPSLTDTAKAMADLAKDGHPVLALLRGFAGLGKIPFDLALTPESYTVEAHIKELQQDLYDMQRHAKSHGGGLLHDWLYGTKDELNRKILITKNQLEALRKHGDKLKAPAKDDAAAASGPDAYEMGLQAEEFQTALKKAFSTQPLDDFLQTFKDRRAKIKEEYDRLKADLSGPATGDASSLDISAELGKGRAALASGDASGAGIARDRLKEMFTSFSSKEDTASFEKSYYAKQLEAFELAIVDASEQAAVQAQESFSKKLAELSADSEKLQVKVDGDAIVAQVKAAVEQIKRDLAANPLAIPVVAVPSVSPSGNQSIDLSDAALKYGRRR